MRRTWYAVQARASADIAALPALTLADARRAFREALRVEADRGEVIGRRFPRIIRITLETKTIKEG